MMDRMEEQAPMHQWIDRMSEYLDGDLKPDEQIAADRHVSGCAQCRQLLHELRRVVERIQEDLPDPLPQALWSNIRHRLTPTPWSAGLPNGSLRRRVRRMPIIYMAAAFVLGGALGTWIGVMLAHQGVWMWTPTWVANAAIAVRSHPATDDARFVQAALRARRDAKQKVLELSSPRAR
ncbi:MAG: hypothetical protein JWM95_4087 [Gemmatimonadetes bacterium]|nr:hypothetical protein [Gemmatimonadota bacterium]